MGDLADFVGMCATSTVLIDQIATLLFQRGCPQIGVSGISLGGWVTNLHHAFCGTATDYIPIFAGAALGEMFSSSVYRKMTGKQARENPHRLRTVLDFEKEYIKYANSSCTPLLARYDQIIQLDVQRGCYVDVPVTTIDKGHVTGALAISTIRNHIQQALGQSNPSNIK
jgi:hypothetical protein